METDHPFRLTLQDARVLRALIRAGKESLSPEDRDRALTLFARLGVFSLRSQSH